MKIAVVGTGYVGLVTGTCLAEMGNTVTCVDIDAEKVESMKNGHVPIFEPRLDLLFHRNISQERLFFTTDLPSAVKSSQIIFLALPTPPGEDGSADLSYILGVADQLGELLNEYKVIIDKSTVPVGTADKVKAAISAKTDIPFDVVSNPEFLREGVAIDDFMKPDRIVVGASSERAKKIVKELYSPFVRMGNPIIFMDERSAEVTKYAANSFLATKISFMNEIANLCEVVGADVNSVRKGIGTDDRIGKRFLFPGVGYGGSCFPKDVQALEKTSRENEYDFKILKSVMQVNLAQREKFVNKVKKFFKGELNGASIAIWGLAFKPNTDDIREAPAIYVIQELLDLGVNISVFDPEAMRNTKKVFGDAIQYGVNQYEVLKNADALLILTEWTVFRTPEFNRMKENLKYPIIFDGRNLYENETMEENGFYYNSIGRNVVSLPK
ncbi:MAG: UDPglucose 6-dehydrogenase [Sphingobacteriales bacterium]|jgi:UDPglucose 6-dehydrogenase